MKMQCHCTLWEENLVPYFQEACPRHLCHTLWVRQTPHYQTSCGWTSFAQIAFIISRALIANTVQLPNQSSNVDKSSDCVREGFRVTKTLGATAGLLPVTPFSACWGSMKNIKRQLPQGTISRSLAFGSLEIIWKSFWLVPVTSWLLPGIVRANWTIMMNLCPKGKSSLGEGVFCFCMCVIHVDVCMCVCVCGNCSCADARPCACRGRRLMPSVLLPLSASYIVRQRHPLEARIQASLTNLARVGWCWQPARHRDRLHLPCLLGS